MIIVHINSTILGSTGMIMQNLHSLALEKGFKSYICFPNSKSNSTFQNKYTIKIGNRFERNLHIFMSYITGLNSLFSILSTLIFLKKLKKIKPDIIHLHNLHNSYINIVLLFKFIKKMKIHLIWTLHDSWAFTGHCTHFDYIGCNRWQKHCGKCPLYKTYPKSLFDTSSLMLKIKLSLYSKIKITVCCPSIWLTNLARKSILINSDFYTINNGVNTNIFKYKESDFREKFNLLDKFIILGVSSNWSYKKGLDVFIELSQKLGNNYKIVLVGIESKQLKDIPPKILSIPLTAPIELSKIYSTADVFVNPTREDNYPTVNLEAISCGTKVITFNSGGSAEMITTSNGFVVEKNNIQKIINIINELNKNKNNKCPISLEFEIKETFKKYIDLYFNEV